MRFGVLGPVLVDGRPPPGAIERALLTRLLVAHGAPVSADELIAAAWPPERRAGAGGSLRVRLAKLRAVLEPDREPGKPAEVLIREPAGYRLVVPPDGVDAERFARLADEAARLPPDAALEACDRALALWRGDPFSDLDSAEATAAESLRLQGVRDRLRHLRALALLGTGRSEEAARELAALVEDDPLREELVRDLMRARYRAGRQAEALAAYRALAQRLARLGLRPGPEVRELEALVLRHADELAPAPRRSEHRTNVGARVASVVGRERELAAILDALDEHRIVTLTGPGGVGKTTLAAEVARAMVQRLPAWIVELAPLRAAAEVIPAAATTLGLRRIGRGSEPDDRDALSVLREHFGDGELLLVLDGAEHLLPDAGRVVRDLAAAGAGVKLLATSRRPLGVAGEAVVQVPPLAVPATDGAADDRAAAPASGNDGARDDGAAASAPPDAAHLTAAERLFVERARAARPGWEPGAEDAPAIARICRRLDGLPLALELAAARLRALPVATIADRLDEGLAALDASIDASHRLLAPAERELLGRLSVFEGAFALEDAESVAGRDVLELLIALSEHSLVQVDGEAPRRYRMLSAIRSYARKRLDDVAVRRHAEHVAALAAHAAALVDGHGAEAAGEPLVPWRADLDAAFRHAIERRDADLALRLAAGLGALHHRLGTVALGVACLEEALALPGGDPQNRLAALYWHVPLLVCELRVDDARAALDQLLELGDDGDPRLRVAAGQVALCAGDLATAESLLAGLPAQLDRRGERFLAGMAAWTLGGAAMARGAAAEAVAHFAAARDHHASCPDVCSLDGAAAELIEAAIAAGREDEAATACEHAIDFAPERPLGERNTHLLHQAAVLAARAGDGDRAAQLTAAAATAAGRDPVVLGPWHAPVAAGDVALLAGRLDAARAAYEEARGLAAEVRAGAGPSLPAEAYLLGSELRLAHVAAAAGDPDAARAHAQAALAHARSSGAPAAIAAAEAALERAGNDPVAAG